MGEDALAAALAGLWAKNRPLVLERAQTVLRELELASTGQPADLSLAAREAHVLAGALGTYGREGSEVFSEVEQTVVSSSSAAPEETALGVLAHRVRATIAEL
ncbi:MAG: hypothetical protein ACT4QF_07490 [Sporichthyaceae bacterium]